MQNRHSSPYSVVYLVKKHLGLRCACRNLQGYNLEGPLAKGLNGLVSLVNL